MMTNQVLSVLSQIIMYVELWNIYMGNKYFDIVEKCLALNTKFVL